MPGRLALPVRNERFGRPMVPFVQPSIRPLDEGSCPVAEDLAFRDAARRCGIRIRADITIRLCHEGFYDHGWEDAGTRSKRSGMFHRKRE